MDLLAALILILVIVLIWRGPKTLPQIGAMFGRGIREARSEAEKLRARTAADGSDEDHPTPG